MEKKMIYLLLTLSMSFSSFVNSSPPSPNPKEGITLIDFLQDRKTRLEGFNYTFTDPNNVKFFELLNRAILYPKSVRNTIDLITASYPYFKPPPETIYNESLEYQQEVFQAMRDLYIDCWNTTARVYYNSYTSGFHPELPITASNDLLEWCVGSTMHQILDLEPQDLLAASKTGFANELSKVSPDSIDLWHNLTNYIFQCIPVEGTSYPKLKDNDTEKSMSVIEDQVGQWLDFLSDTGSSRGESFTLDRLNFWTSHPESFRKSMIQEDGTSGILQDFPFFATDDTIREFNNTAIYKATTLLLANESTTLLQEGIELLRDTFVEMINMHKSESNLTSRYMKVSYEFNMSEVTLLQVAKISGKLWNFNYVHDLNNSRYLLNLDDNGVFGKFLDTTPLPKNRMTERVRKNINGFIKLYWKVMESRGISTRGMTDEDRAIMCYYKSMAERIKDDEAKFPKHFLMNMLATQAYGLYLSQVLDGCFHCRVMGYMIDQAISDAHNGSNTSLPHDLTFFPLLEQVRDFLKDAPGKYQEQGYTLTKHLYEHSWLLESTSEPNYIPHIFMTGTSNDCENGEKCPNALLRILQIWGQKMGIKYVDKFGQESVIKNGVPGTFRCMAASGSRLSLIPPQFFHERMKDILNDFVTFIFEIQKIKKDE